MDLDSPFASAGFSKSKPQQSTGVVHVNYCDNCHYVWKGPVVAEKCLNCKDEPVSVRSLVSYSNDAPRI